MNGQIVFTVEELQALAAAVIQWPQGSPARFCNTFKGYENDEWVEVTPENIAAALRYAADLKENCGSCSRL